MTLNLFLFRKIINKKKSSIKHTFDKSHSSPPSIVSIVNRTNMNSPQEERKCTCQPYITMIECDVTAALEIANEINRQALMKHFFFHQPVEALKLHLKALDIEIEFSLRLNRGIEGIKEQEIIEEQHRRLACDFMVTLIDIGNCFWSSRPSKIAYYSALMIDTLMEIDKPFLRMSILNRLSKLEPQGFKPPVMTMDDWTKELMTTSSAWKEHLHDDDIASFYWSFRKSIEVTKMAVARMQQNCSCDK